METSLLAILIVALVLWICTTVVIVVYIRFSWSSRLDKMEEYLKEYDWRIAATEAKFIRTQDDLKDIKRKLL